MLTVDDILRIHLGDAEFASAELCSCAAHADPMAAPHVQEVVVPACDRHAGWASAGDRANTELRAIATGRGPLRRVLDDLRPGDGGR